MAKKPEPEIVGGAPAWTATFGDTMTLLMTFFILLVTFSTNNPYKIELRRSTVIDGEGGSGVVTEKVRAGDKNSIIWSLVPPPLHTSHQGSEMPPLYGETLKEQTDEVVARIEAVQNITLKDSYSIRIPLAMLFDGEQFSESGRTLLKTMSQHLEPLPYDMQIEVSDKGLFGKAHRIVLYFMEERSFVPSRLAIGLAPPGKANQQDLVFTCIRQR
ncbi:MAG: hypothetical protein KatS3mg105_0223 [Gemmatales bacterium]|nr:MAG: hypothetical protein KatS3mg105_0223 [Gemmatales bacterium]